MNPRFPVARARAFAPAQAPAQVQVQALSAAALILLLQGCGAGLTNAPDSTQTPFVLTLTENLPASATAGECAEYQYTLRVVEREDRKTVYMDSDLEISLSTSSPTTELENKGFIQTSSACTGSSSTVTITEGLAEVTFYLQLNSDQISEISFTTNDERVGALSTSIAVTPNIPGTLELSTLPDTAGINTVFTSAPTVRILDSWGNFISDAASALEIEPFTNDTCSQAASGTLQNSTSTAIDGIGAFNTLRYTLSGTIYLRVQIPATQIRSNCAGPIVVQ